MPSDNSDGSDDEARTPRRPTMAELRHHRRTYPQMPVIAEPDLEGGPSDQIDSLYNEPIRPTARDADACRRAGVDPDERVRAIDLSAMMKLLEWRIYQRVQVDHQRVADTLERLVETVEGDGGLVKTVAEHGHVIRPVRSTASWALRGTVAAIIVLGGFLYQRGSAEQHVTDEIQTQRRDYERLQAEVKELRIQISKDTRP